MNRYLRPLSTRETQVLHLIAFGYTDKEIGQHLDIADNTVYRHVINIRMKLGAVNRCHAVFLASTRDLLPPELALGPGRARWFG